MKREGRQHGLVRTYPIISPAWNPRSSSSRRINKLNSPPTAGLFTRVSPKPTNHSKFTGKCGRPRCASCHIHPAGKAKEKSKGTQKIRSCDVRPGLRFSGISATGILDHLADDYLEDEIEDDYEENNHGVADSDWMADSVSANNASRIVEIEEIDGSNGDHSAGDEDEDDRMSFCDVDIVLKHVEEGDEGWYLVEDLQNCI